MANKIAVKFDAVSLIQAKSRLAIPYKAASERFVNPKIVNAVLFPQQTNLVSTVTFRNITQGHSIYVTFRSATGVVDPSVGANVIFRSIDEDHTITALFERLPYPLLTKKTVLLLHFEGSENSHVFMDSSSYEHFVSVVYSIAIYQTVGLTRTKKRWGLRSAYFSNYGSMSTTSDDYILGTNDFTIDFWFQVPFLIYEGSLASWLFRTSSLGSTGSLACCYTREGANDYYINVLINGTTVIQALFPDFEIDQWFHVAVVRTSGVLKVFLDGVPFAETAVVPDSLSDGAFVIPVDYPKFIDEFRVVNGEAVWTDTFTPPTGPYSDEMSPELDLLFEMSLSLTMTPVSSLFVGDYIKLLAHMDGSEGSATLSDSSKYRHDMTAEGTTHLTSAGNVLAGIAAMFTGANSLAIPDSNEFNLSSGDFTFDFWLKFDAVIDTTVSRITRLAFFGQDDATYPFYMEYQRGTFRTIVVKVGGIAVPYRNDSVIWYSWWTRDYDNWYYDEISNGLYAHVALVKSGLTTYVYVNGVKLDANDVLRTGYNFTYTDLTGLFRIGQAQSSFLNGSMKKFRFSKGIARWTADEFDPTTIDYTVDQYTRLYLPMSGTIDSTVFTNQGLATMPITNVNGVKIGNPGNSFGNSAALFNGIDEFISVEPSSYWNLGTRDFTIDFRARVILRQVSGQSIFLSDHYPFISYGVKGTSDFFSLEFNSSNSNAYTVVLTVGTRTFVGYFLAAYHLNAFTDQEWHHIALVSYQRQISIYYDGVALIQNYFYVNPANYAEGYVSFPSSNTELLIGSDTEYFYKGYIDEVRILHKADWTTNFTIPVEPYDDPPTEPIPGGTIEISSEFDGSMSLETVFRKPGEYDIEHNLPMSMEVSLPDLVVHQLAFNIPLQLVMLREGTTEHVPFVFSNKWKSTMLADYSDVPGVAGDYRVALMSMHFVFDPDVHEYFVGYVDSYEIDSVHGYASNTSIVFSALSAEGVLSFEDVWLPTASDGGYGPVNSVMIIDYASSVSGMIVGSILLPKALMNYGTLKLSDLSFQIV